MRLIVNDRLRIVGTHRNSYVVEVESSDENDLRPILLGPFKEVEDEAQLESTIRDLTNYKVFYYSEDGWKYNVTVKW